MPHKIARIKTEMTPGECHGKQHLPIHNNNRRATTVCQRQKTQYAKAPNTKPLKASRALGSSASHQAINNNVDIVMKARRLSAVQKHEG